MFGDGVAPVVELHYLAGPGPSRCAVLEGHTSQVKCCALAPGAAAVVSGDRLGGVMLWRAEAPPDAQAEGGGAGSSGCGDEAAPDEAAAAAAAPVERRQGPAPPRPPQQRRHTVAVPLGELPLAGYALTGGHARGVAIKCCCVSADGRVAATGAADGGIALWDIGSPEPRLLAASYAPKQEEPPACGDGGGDAAAAAGSEGGADAGEERPATEGEQQQHHRKSASGSSCGSNGGGASPRGAGRQDGPGAEAHHRPLQIAPLSSDPVLCCCLSADGAVLAAGGKGGRVGVWAGARRALVELRQRHADGTRVRAVAASPDGRKLATGGDDGRVVLWDLGRAPGGGAGVALLTLPEHARPVRALAFSADGARLASAGDDSLICLFDVVLLASYGAPRGCRATAAAAAAAGGAVEVRAGMPLGLLAASGGSNNSGGVGSTATAAAAAANEGARSGGGCAAAGSNAAVMPHPLLRRVRVAGFSDRLLACAPLERAHLPPLGPLGLLGPAALAPDDDGTAAAGALAGAPEGCPYALLCVEQSGQVRVLPAGSGAGADAGELIAGPAASAGTAAAAAVDGELVATARLDGTVCVASCKAAAAQAAEAAAAAAGGGSSNEDGDGGSCGADSDLNLMAAAAAPLPPPEPAACRLDMAAYAIALSSGLRRVAVAGSERKQPGAAVLYLWEYEPAGWDARGHPAEAGGAGAVAGTGADDGTGGDSAIARGGGVGSPDGSVTGGVTSGRERRSDDGANSERSSVSGGGAADAAERQPHGGGGGAAAVGGLLARRDNPLRIDLAPNDGGPLLCCAWAPSDSPRGGAPVSGGKPAALVAGSSGGWVVVVDLTKEEHDAQTRYSHLHGGAAVTAVDLAVTAYGAVGVSGGADGQIVVWAAATGFPFQKLRLHHAAIRSLRFAAGDPNRVAAADAAGAVSGWDVARGALLAAAAAHEGSAADCRFADGGGGGGDGNGDGGCMLVSCGYDGHVGLLRVSEEKDGRRVWIVVVAAQFLELASVLSF